MPDPTGPPDGGPIPHRQTAGAQVQRCEVVLLRHAGLRAPSHLGSMEWRTKPRLKRPGIIEPCIPTRLIKPPVGPQWIHEIKHDGYRMIARKRDSGVRLFTRNGFDWSDRYPRISEAVAVRGGVVRRRWLGDLRQSCTAAPMTAR